MEEERAAVVKWLRDEAAWARHSQHCTVGETDKLYRMGQKDAYLLAAEAIERGHHSLKPGPPDMAGVEGER